MESIHAKYNRNFALFVLLSTFAVFAYTVAPTVAFWDCGEYVGASHSLGVPHPPGNPLYVMLGRVFSILFFFFNQVAFRVNMISIFSASFTAMFIYLIIVRTMVSWVGIPDINWKRTIVYLSGVTGAFFAVFGYTFWFSSVEASVYVPSMFVIVICTWLVIKWAQSNDTDRDHLLLLVAYISFLGIGIHMMGMLAMAPVFLYVALTDENKLKDWRLWITFFAMTAVMYNVSLFLWLGPLTVVGTLVMSFMEKNAKKKWRFCFWVAFFALMGYSIHAYIPIRSTARPIIDENHPVVKIDESGKINWKAFKYFLERKQYGSESMVTRMFHRLGAFKKQFGIDGHMGYGGFHLTQYFHFGRSVYIDRNKTVFENWGAAGGMIRLLLYLIPTFLMIYGWTYLYQKNKNLAIMLILIFIACSIGLVLYMNFADGHHALKRDYIRWVRDGRQGPLPAYHREVRIRDYFFTSGFMFMGMWIGIAFGCILHSLFTNKNRFIRTQLAPIMVILFAVSPALPLTQNFKENNRRKDWVPYDYAYNLLMSCDRDGILFTNGDNDTFPLWFLQEAEGVRRDVRIVNLSLLNTKWYIVQLKMLEPKVPISYSYREIEEKLNHQLNPLEKAVLYKMPKAGILVKLPGRDTKQALKVQDQMVINIIDSNKWKKPIYFAITVSRDNLMGLDPYLKMEGLVYRIMQKKVPDNEKLDLERTLFFLDKVYSFRSLGDGSAPVNETGEKLMSNYASSFIQIAVFMRQTLRELKGKIKKLEYPLPDSVVESDSTLITERKKELEETKRKYKENLDMVSSKLDQCINIIPWDWRVRMLQQEILMDHNRLDLAMERIKQALIISPGDTRYLKLKARLHDMRGEKIEANKILKELVGQESDSWTIYSLMCQNYQKLGLYDSAILMMKQFQEIHPGDRRAAVMIHQFEKMKEEAQEKKNKPSEVEDSIEVEKSVIESTSS